MGQNRRKKYLIRLPLQLRYLSYIVATLLIVSAGGITGTYYGIWAAVLNAFSQESLGETLQMAAHIQDYEEARRHPPKKIELTSIRFFREIDLLSARQQEILEEILDDTFQTLIPLGLLLCLLIGIGSIYLTHKIAGPLFKLEQYLNMLAKGDLTVRIHFRRYDEVGHLADIFNEMTTKLDQKISRLKHLTGQASSTPAFDELKRELSQIKTTSA